MNTAVLRAPSRAVAVLGALALALSMLALTPAAFADAHEPEVDRLAGADRFGTAADVASETFPDGATDVIIAAGFRFPDSLAAGGFAGQIDGPILLVNDVLNEATAETLAALEELDPERLHIAGGTVAVSTVIRAQLEAAGDWELVPYSGADRFDTAALMAEEFDPTLVDTVVVATGRVPADSLAVGPLAFHGEYPILLTEVNELPDRTAEVLEALAPDTVLILGGPVAVSQSVEDDIEAITGEGSTERLAGDTRFETAIDIAEYASANFPEFFLMDEVSVATGFGPDRFTFDDNPMPADALSGAPYGGANGSPLIPINDILDTVPASICDFLEANADTIAFVTIFGGTAAVSTSVENTVVDCATTDVVPVQTFTEAPELIGVDIVNVVSDAIVADYQFDEPVDGKAPEAASFKLYAFDDTAAPETGNTATVDAGSDTVRVEFTGIAAPAQDFLDEVTVATVAFDAVWDQDDTPNPEGDVALQEVEAEGPTSTDAPDLISVENFEDEPVLDPTFTSVDFVFDEDATFVAGGEYRLVLTDGETDILCTAPVAGDTTDTHTVECDDGGDPIDPADVARGYVIAGTVDDGAANTNPLQAADVAGTSATPDLVDIEIDEDNDRIRFTFDESVRLPGLVDDSDDGDFAGALGDWVAYEEDATTEHNPTRVVVQPDRTVVVAQFADDDISIAVVGASVAAGAVVERSAPNDPNLPDEQRRAEGELIVLAEAGTTDAPDLVAVSELVEVVDPLTDTFEHFEVTFTFNEDVDDTSCAANEALFRLYLVDGTQFEGTGIEDCGEDEPTEVVVSFDDEDAATAALGAVAADAVHLDGDVTLLNPEGAAGVGI